MIWYEASESLHRYLFLLATNSCRKLIKSLMINIVVNRGPFFPYNCRIICQQIILYYTTIFLASSAPPPLKVFHNIATISATSTLNQTGFPS